MILSALNGSADGGYVDAQGLSDVRLPHPSTVVEVEALTLSGRGSLVECSDDCPALVG